MARGRRVKVTAINFARNINGRLKGSATYG